MYEGRWIEEDGRVFKETARFRVCPREKVYGIQVPLGVWHSIEVHEPSTIFEAKDGAYGVSVTNTNYTNWTNSFSLTQLTQRTQILNKNNKNSTFVKFKV